MKKILAAILGLALIVPNSAVFADVQKSQNSVEQPSTVTKIVERSSEYQYVQALATQKNISYELASRLNDIENTKKLKTSNEISMRSAPEVVKYKTVYGYSSIAGKNVEMTAQVKYVYSNVTNSPESIINITGPYMYIQGVTMATMNGGDYVIEQTRTTGRVSRTANFTYQVDASAGIQVGNDIVSVSASVGGSVYVTTRAKTFVLNIKLSDLR